MLKPWWRHNWFVEFFLYFTTLKELCRIKKKFLDILYQSIKIPIYNLKSIWRGDKELFWCRFWEIVGILDMFHLSKMRFFLLFFPSYFAENKQMIFIVFNRITPYQSMLLLLWCIDIIERIYNLNFLKYTFYLLDLDPLTQFCTHVKVRT